MKKPAQSLLATTAALGWLLSLSAAGAANITYTVRQKIGHGSVTGTITTDGKLGTLAASDIVAWSLTLKGPGAKFALTNANSIVYESGSDLSATAKHLYFNYNGTDNGWVVFQVQLFSGYNYWCNAVTTQNFDCAAGASVVPQYVTNPSAQFAARTGKVKIAKQ